jgi:hypothetical protein
MPHHWTMGPCIFATRDALQSKLNSIAVDSMIEGLLFPIRDSDDVEYVISKVHVTFEPKDPPATTA